MSIEAEINQYNKELTYSKRQLIKIAKRNVEEEGDEIVRLLVTKINKYLHGQYWDSKQDYITAICLTDISTTDIAEELLALCLIHSNTVINTIASALGELFSQYIDDVFVRVQVASDILFECQDIVYTLTKLVEGINFKSIIKISGEDALTITKFTYLPPMLCKPIHINNNSQSGYLTFNDSIILGDRFKRHNKTIRLDVINILNSIKFTLDPAVIKEKEVSKKELKGVNITNFNTFVKESTELHKEYINREFYFNHKLDSRGRIYCQGLI